MSRILRELSPSEKILDYETRECNLMDSRAFLISSKVSIFQNIQLFEKGLKEWKNIHDLLKACIYVNNKQRYFALASDSVANSLENVKFLKFDVFNKENWKILYENELIKAYDHENGLLWRLYFIEDEIVDDLYFYRIIFTIHHALADGKNHFCLLQQLLQIIERLYLEKPLEINNYGFLSSIEGMLTDVDEDEQEAVVKSYKVPLYLRPKNIKCQIEETLTSIYTHDNQLYSTLNLLISENLSKSNSKFLSFIIERETFARILKKCKLNEMKLTGYLSICIKKAISRANAHFSDGKQVERVFRYFIAASSRPALNIDNYKVGNLATIIYFETKSIKENEKFWQLAKTESDELHYKIATNDVIESLKEDFRFLKHIEKGFYFDEFEKEYCLSNLGDMSSFSSTDSRLFEIKEHYVVQSNKKLSSYYLFFIGLATIDNRLFWTITYPRHLIDYNVAIYIVENIKLIINESLE